MLRNRRKGFCSLCNGGPKLLERVDPQTKLKICRKCSDEIRGCKSSHPLGTCEKCLEEKRLISNKTRLCSRCFNKAYKQGFCPNCGKGPRTLANRDPETKMLICQYCFNQASGYKQKIRSGFCSQCGKGPRNIHYRNETCNVCAKKQKKLAARLAVAT